MSAKTCGFIVARGLAVLAILEAINVLRYLPNSIGYLLQYRDKPNPYWPTIIADSVAFGFYLLAAFVLWANAESFAGKHADSDPPAKALPYSVPNLGFALVGVYLFIARTPAFIQFLASQGVQARLFGQSVPVTVWDVVASSIPPLLGLVLMVWNLPKIRRQGQLDEEA